MHATFGSIPVSQRKWTNKKEKTFDFPFPGVSLTNMVCLPWRCVAMFARSNWKPSYILSLFSWRRIAFAHLCNEVWTKYNVFYRHICLWLTSGKCTRLNRDLLTFNNSAKITTPNFLQNILLIPTNQIPLNRLKASILFLQWLG